MEASVERACRKLGYVNAGTFEFLLGPEGDPYFIEVNCRLQVEHPVTELVTGIDVVREQIRVADGANLSHVGRAERGGHAIEVRINAEDPARAFAPAPGTVTRFRPPLGPGVRVDTAMFEGAAIPPYYDSLIAKLIVHDDTRAAAIARAVRALGKHQRFCGKGFHDSVHPGIDGFKPGKTSRDNLLARYRACPDCLRHSHCIPAPQLVRHGSLLKIVWTLIPNVVAASRAD
jgi:acetyl/propionyl-CoA carboxylase alpha subunit